MNDTGDDLDHLGLRLNFFKLAVDDMEAMVAFWTEAFGMEVRHRDGSDEVTETMLAMPGDRFNLVLYHWTDDRALTMGNAHGAVGFLTADVDAAVARATAHGATVETGAYDVGPTRLAVVADPEGHPIQFIKIGR